MNKVYSRNFLLSQVPPTHSGVNTTANSATPPARAIAMARHLLLLLAAASLLLLLPATLAKPAPAAARRADIPFIKCQVCEKLARQIHARVATKQSQISPQKLSEFEIIEVVEKVCDLKKEEAEWIFQIDIVENGDKLELVERGTEGQCNSKCKTIERTCQEVLGDSDTDVAEFLFKSKPSVDLLVNYLCKDLSKACSSKPPPVPKDRTPGEPFVPKPSKDAEMEKIMRSMQGMPGAPNMKMYSREDLMNNKFGAGEVDEDDDDEEEDSFPSNLGKVLQEKVPPKKDLKQKLIKGVEKTGAMVKKKINTVSQKIKKWWKGMKTNEKPAKASKIEL